MPVLGAEFMAWSLCRFEHTIGKPARVSRPHERCFAVANKSILQVQSDAHAQRKANKVPGTLFKTTRKRFVAWLCRFCFALRSMKSLTERLFFEIPHRRGYVNITDKVAALVRRSGVKEGLCLVNAMHISASVFINDNEEGLLHDFDVWLERLAPHAPITQYRHNMTGEDNADAHLKRQVMGREVVIAITDGELDFGPWEQIFYGEFDGRRRKAVLVKIIGE